MCISIRNFVSHLRSMGLSRHFSGGTAASKLQILCKADEAQHFTKMSLCLVSYLFHPPFCQFLETGYNNVLCLLETSIFLLKCAFRSFGQNLLRMNVSPDDPGCSHLLDAQQPLRLILAVPSSFFLPPLS